MAHFISTAGQAASVIGQDLQRGTRRAVPRAGTSAFDAGRVARLADWLITLVLKAPAPAEEQKSLLRSKSSIASILSLPALQL